MMQDLIALLILILIMFGLVFGVTTCGRYVKCKNKYAEQHAEFGVFEGCQIYINGDRIPADNWRHID